MQTFEGIEVSLDFSIDGNRLQPLMSWITFKCPYTKNLPPYTV